MKTHALFFPNLREAVFLVAMIFCSVTLMAQDDPTAVPIIFPASPEAATLGRFGEVPVNSAVGMASFSVPVYTFSEKDIELPIALNYQHNGLIVDQIPGHLGVGWNLAAGGMVTRQVRGKPDDHINGYCGELMTGANRVLPYLNNTLPAIQRKILQEDTSNGIVDTQPDKFVVSVGSMSATFYLDENRQPIILPYKPYIIEPVFSNDKIVRFNITDDKGVLYIFSEEEQTRRVGGLTGGEHPLAPLFNWYTSGWKLTQISTPDNKTIDFSYEDVHFFQKSLAQSFTNRTFGNCDPSSTSYTTRYYEVKSKLIKEIDFLDGKLEFNNSIVSFTTNHLSNYNKYRSRLNSIELKNDHNQVISRFDLQYDDINKTRKLLTEVKLNSDNTNTYGFEYNGAPSDNINLAQQDFWGYYNNNGTGKLIDNLNVFDLYGLRQPDFEKAKTGSLKKITYPTKGYTEITYEPNSVDPTNNQVPYECTSAQTNMYVPIHAYLGYTDQQNGIHEKTNSTTITIEEPYLYADILLWAEKVAGEDGEVWGDATAYIYQVGGVTEACADQACAGEVAPYPLLGCQGRSISLDAGPLHTEEQLRKYTRRVKLNPGQYELFVEVKNLWGTPGVPGPWTVGDVITAKAEISFYEDDGSPPPLAVEVGGMRVSNIRSCPDNDPTNCVITEYIYENDEGVSLGQLFRKRNLTSYNSTRIINTSSTNCYSTYTNYSSSSNLPLAYFMGSHVFYNDVKEQKVSHAGAALGYTKRKYIFPSVPQNETYPFIQRDTKDYKNGKISLEQIYNDQDELLVESDYQYQFTGTLNGIDQTVYGLNIGSDEVHILETPTFGIITTYVYKDSFSTFENTHQFDLLAAMTTKHWEDGVLIEKETTYTYTNPQSHRRTQEDEDSDGSVLKSEYLYPYDISLGVYNQMIFKNRIAKPVQTKKYIDNALISNVKMEYKNWGVNIITPEIVKTAKGTNSLEDRLIYYNYDGDGNPLDLAKASGTRISYIWGYNSIYPIAQLEGVPYSDIPASTIINLKTLSNNDNDSCDGTGSCNETSLRNALDGLRLQFPNALITTYTYDPMVGPTSVTDPTGQTLFYRYDNQNRLEYVIDLDGNVLNKTEYNFKN